MGSRFWPYGVLLLEAGTRAAGFLEAEKGAAWEAEAGTRVCCCCSCNSSGDRAAGFLELEKEAAWAAWVAGSGTRACCC